MRRALPLFWPIALLVTALLPLLQWAWYQAELPQAQAGYPATDWVRWEESPQGLRVAELLPPATSRARLQGPALRVGDVLLTVDYLPVRNLATLQPLVAQAAPGTVRLYQVQRPQPNTPDDVLAVYVTSGYRPLLLPIAPGWVAHLGLAMHMLLALGAGVLLVLARPFAQRQEGGLRLMMALYAVLLAFGLWQALRFVLLLLDPQQQRLYQEQAGVAGAMLLLVAVAALLPRLRHQHPRPHAGLLLAGGLACVPMVPALLGQGPSLGAEGPMLAGLSATLFLAVAVHYAPPAQRVEGLLLATALLGWVGSLVWLLLPNGGAPPFWLLAVALALVAVPVATSGGRWLRFGKAREVLPRLAAALAALLGLALFYAGLEAAFQPLIADALTRGFLEGLLLMAVVLAGRYLLRRYPSRFLQLASSERQQEALQRFTASLPRFTQPAQLSQALADTVQSYVGTPSAQLWLSTDTQGAQAGAPLPATHEELARLADTLNAQQGFWAAEEALAPSMVPPGLASTLRAAGIALALPLRIGDHAQGLLLVGRKRRGVLNLTELEALQRLTSQVRLALEVLFLLEREKALAAQTAEANLAALRAQINPHFLFNTLNTIMALIHDAPDEAEQALEKLAFIFRYTLQHGRAAFVELGSELRLVRTYLEIEQLRFGERFSFVIDWQEALAEVRIPGFVLQTIVENAVKHGTAKIVGKGHILITAQNTPQGLSCTVSDNGPGIQPGQEFTSHGLNNILTRMQELYQQKDLIRFENTGAGTTVHILFPPSASAHTTPTP